MNTPRPVSLCTLIRAAFVLVVALAWLLRSLVPAGYMPANNDTLSQGVFANLTVCSQGLQWAPHPSPQAPIALRARQRFRAGRLVISVAARGGGCIGWLVLCRCRQYSCGGTTQLVLRPAGRLPGPAGRLTFLDAVAHILKSSFKGKL
jgi:hypothetical protein